MSGIIGVDGADNASLILTLKNYQVWKVNFASFLKREVPGVANHIIDGSINNPYLGILGTCIGEVTVAGSGRMLKQDYTKGQTGLAWSKTNPAVMFKDIEIEKDQSTVKAVVDATKKWVEDLTKATSLMVTYCNTDIKTKMTAYPEWELALDGNDAREVWVLLQKYLDAGRNIQVHTQLAKGDAWVAVE
jgi:hypothetical protein